MTFPQEMCLLSFSTSNELGPSLSLCNVCITNICIRISVNYQSVNCRLIGRTVDVLYPYIEEIQMFLLNMAFISSSEVENIYIS